MNILDFADLCPHTIVLEPMTGRDDYGKPVYGTPQTFRGRRSFKVSRVASYERGTKGQGAEVISSSTIWILGLPSVGYEDKAYVRGDTQFPPILSIQRIPDEGGDLYVKLFMGSSNG